MYVCAPRRHSGGFKPLHLHIFIMAKSQACATAAWPFAGKQAV